MTIHYTTSADTNFIHQRSKMIINQLEERGIHNPAVLDAMNNTPRHLFVPKSLQNLAYEDSPLPLDLDQTISQPFIVGLMSQAAHISPQDRVLEIGTGSGYQAAILSHLAKEVYSIEILNPLGLSAQNRLKDLGYDNVLVKIGDGNLGWKEEAPFDVILVTAGGPEIPPALIKQLKNGGRLIMPIGTRYDQTLFRITKKESHLQIENLGSVVFVPLTKELP